MSTFDPAVLCQAWDASRTGDSTKLKQLFARHSGLENARELIRQRTWLHVATEEGHLELVRDLFQRGASLNEHDQYGDCPLSAIADIGNVVAAKWMVDNGADPSLSNSPMVAAVSKGCLEIVKLFIERGASYNFVFGDPPRTPLSQAINFGHKDVADYLGSLGAKMPPTGDDEIIDAELAQDRFDASTEIKEYFEYVNGNAPHPNGLQELIPGKVGVSVWTIPPKNPGDMMIIFTTGLSDLPMTVPPGRESFRFAELAMQLPGNWPFPPNVRDERELWPWIWLRNIAHDAHESETWLGDGETTFANGDPGQTHLKSCPG